MLDQAYIGLGSSQSYNGAAQSKSQKNQQINQQTQRNESTNQPQKKVLRMVQSERMGGSMPVWETPKTAKQGVEQNLGLAQSGDSDFKTALAYAGQQEVGPDKEFGFGDVIDMVNPLHHIPLVGHVYREITGDEIKPIGKIIGGGVFGGPAGAAAGLVDAALVAETGKDMAGNAMGFISGDMPSLNNPADQSENPERRLNDALESLDHDALPANLLAFADSGQGRRSGISIDRVTIKRIPTYQHRFETSPEARDVKRSSAKDTMKTLPEREDISKVSISNAGLYRAYNS